jgi:hypothetical protein
MGELRLVVKGSMGEPEGKRPLGRPRHRWEDNIRIGFGRLAVCGVDSVDLGYGILLSELRRLRVFV